MCAPLTINCQQRRHALTLGSKYIVPCSKPGSEACRKGEAEPNETWQNSPTECVARYLPQDEFARAVCRENLQKYGQAVYEMNKHLMQNHGEGEGDKKTACTMQ